ncbi:helix-turn-helix domain-containing protein [Roseivivax sp. CAU 1761]
MLSPNEAAARAGVSRRTIMRALKNAQLKGYQDNKDLWQIHPESFEAWASARRTAQVTTPTPPTPDAQAELRAEIKLLQGTVELRDARISELEAELHRERTRAEAELDRERERSEKALNDIRQERESWRRHAEELATRLPEKETTATSERPTEPRRFRLWPF